MTILTLASNLGVKLIAVGGSLNGLVVYRLLGSEYTQLGLPWAVTLADRACVALLLAAARRRAGEGVGGGLVALLPGLQLVALRRWAARRRPAGMRGSSTLVTLVLTLIPTGAGASPDIASGVFVVLVLSVGVALIVPVFWLGKARLVVRLADLHGIKGVAFGAAALLPILNLACLAWSCLGRGSFPSEDES